MSKLRLATSEGFTVAKLLEVRKVMDNAVCDKCEVKFIDGFPNCGCWARQDHISDEDRINIQRLFENKV